MRALIVLLLVCLGPGAPPGAQTPPQEPELLAAYRRRLDLNPDNAFYQFAVYQTARRFGLEPPPVSPGPARGGRRWRAQLYEMTTGAAAIQEALQLDRLASGGDTDSPATVPIASVRALETPSHPFEKLLEGRLSSMEPLARAAPHDWYYAHFTSIPAMRRVLGASERWGAHLLQMYTIGGRDRRLRDRIEGQLLLSTRADLDSFYDLVAGSVAVVGSDPFFFEGSDVTVVVTLKNALVFSSRLELARREAVGRTPDIAFSSETHRDWRIDGLVSRGRAVSSFAAVRSGIGIVSTSRAALRQVIDTIEGASPSMAAAKDFQYMRSVYPFNAAEEDSEDGFVFLSDAFVRRVVGPRLKIGEARRVRCAVSLQTAAYGVLLYMRETGRPPETLDTLIATKYLDRASLRCPDGGIYGLDNGAPVCTVHNRLGSLTPNLELKLDSVTPEEVAAYDEFREEYKNYWRRFVDPVGVRMRVREAIDVEATILPLVENSAYDDMKRGFGGGPVPLARPQLPNAIVIVDAKLPKGDWARSFSPFTRANQRAYDRAFGDWFTIQVADSAPGLAPNLTGVFGEELRSLDEWIYLAPLVSSLIMPTLVAAPIADRSALDEVLAAMRAEILEESRPSNRNRWVQVEGYQVLEGGSRPVESVVIHLLSLVRIRLYYAAVGSLFVVASERALIDQLGQASPSESEAGNVRFELAPGRWNAIAPAMALGYAEDSRHACVANLPWLEVLARAYGRQPHELAAESFAQFGEVFVCPDGGRYAAEADGRTLCTLHGTREAPRQGPRPQPGSSAAFVIERVKRIKAALSFTPEGISTRVRIE